MRWLSTLAVLALPGTALAEDWRDVPKLLASATSPVDAELRACMGKKPHGIAMIAGREKDGTTSVAMPMPPVGGRGYTPEEKCLDKTIAKIVLPALPAEVDRVLLGHTVDTTDDDKAWDTWRDLPKTLVALVGQDRRATLGACDRKPRTVRVVLDLRRGATRAWLPAWQFHSAAGDGKTPAAEARVKACLGKALRGWKPAKLPKAMAELELALGVKP